ncbi:helix-turn-helix domain-containing protein [Dasania marina]|uniref:MerR family transcriptional regulator n=1 Tax=Dasania marina TaxID=471499 RepID=UPI0030DC14AE|tara:strand:+ start:23193 stop:23600 length:408 start_codon:yes stop_codon:yes gene_type:complete
MTTSRTTYSRGELAKLTAVKAETIRYYEKCGLLKAPARSAGGHRIYSAEHAGQLKFIRRCRELGFTINEIEGLLSLASIGEKSCQQVQQATTAHLSDVHNKIKDLKKMEKTLKDLVKQCEGNTAPSCPIIETLFS